MMDKLLSKVSCTIGYFVVLCFRPLHGCCMRYLPIALLVTLVQCTPSQPTEEAEAAKPSVSATPAVAVQTAQRKAFRWLLLSNGRVSNQLSELLKKLRSNNGCTNGCVD